MDSICAALTRFVECCGSQTVQSPPSNAIPDSRQHVDILDIINDHVVHSRRYMFIFLLFLLLLDTLLLIQLSNANKVIFNVIY